MEVFEVKAIIEQSIPNSRVEVTDMTGTKDHFQILVVSDAFKGKMLIDQHRIVQKSLEGAFEDGRIHAVHIKTETPGTGKTKPGANDFPILH